MKAAEQFDLTFHRISNALGAIPRLSRMNFVKKCLKGCCERALVLEGTFVKQRRLLFMLVLTLVPFYQHCVYVLLHIGDPRLKKIAEEKKAALRLWAIWEAKDLLTRKYPRES